MVSRRRPIHPESYVEEDENKQVKKCITCGETSIEDDTEHEPSEKKLGIDYQSNGENLVHQNSNEASFQCKNCVSNQKTTNEKNKYAVDKIKLITIGLVVIVVAIIPFVYYSTWQEGEKQIAVRVQNQTQDEIDFDDELYGLENIYKRQEERVWFTFAAGIKSVLTENPNKPSVFLLLYDDDGAENTVKCLAQDVTKAASKYLMKREIKPVIQAGRELNRKDILNDPGRLLVFYKNDVKTKGAMIITNLEDVQPKVAAGFHFFCDRYSPLVEKAIYLFTLKLNQVPKVPKLLQKAAEDRLHSLWASDLPDNILQPLITRMTGNVLRISNDYSDC